MSAIYLFSGLGADERAFGRLDFYPAKTYHIKWHRPLAQESIQEYAQQIAEQITELNPILIGLSFGGIMAIEVSKVLPAYQQLILISSVKTKNEIPWYFRWAGKIGLYKLILTGLLKVTNPFIYWLFGLKNKEDKQLFKAMLKDADSVFMKWAIRQILTWQNKGMPSNLIHIHGKTDRLLPIRYIKNALKIDNAGHFMIYNQAVIINDILKATGPIDLSHLSY
jgi:pimeloyl-ACP methyl ester carboxylesterase